MKQWLQASLPIKDAELGIRHVAVFPCFSSQHHFRITSYNNATWVHNTNSPNILRLGQIRMPVAYLIHLNCICLGSTRHPAR